MNRLKRKAAYLDEVERGHLEGLDQDRTLIHVDGSADNMKKERPSYICLLKVGAGKPIVTKCRAETNNEAEYAALVSAVTLMTEPGHRYYIFMDSELVVKQMAGEYKCREPRMREYRDLAELKIRESGATIGLLWVPREHNRAGHHLEDYLDALKGVGDGRE